MKEHDPVFELELPSCLLTDKEFRDWRGVVYRRGERCHIEALFESQLVPFDADTVLFWATIYGAIRVLTAPMFPWEAIYARKVQRDDESDDPDEQLLSWWGISCRAQFWLDRQGFTLLPHRGRLRYQGFQYPIPRKYFS